MNSLANDDPNAQNPGGCDSTAASVPSDYERARAFLAAVSAMGNTLRQRARVHVRLTLGRGGMRILKPMSMPIHRRWSAMRHHTRSAVGVGDTFGTVDDAGVRRSLASDTRFASRAEAATVTARQSRPLDRGGLSIRSDSSSHSSVESLACSGPNNSVTARMNADNSRSAILIWSSQVEWGNDFSLSMGPSR